jgi:uncharacterized Ntn-hydrolase superfamily protein
MSGRRIWPQACIAERARAVRALVAGAALVLLACAPAWGAAERIATFSIVGFDPETGDLGVAVQSKFFAVGSVVPWAEAGVGAIATQAFGNTSFGPRGLALLKEGIPVEDVLTQLLEVDEDREQRQIGIVDAQGRSAAFTGDSCLVWAGHKTGPGFAAQGNILVSAETVEAMAAAFVETQGILGERLMRAIEAGQEAGGDSRGVQSAAILIVREGGGYGGFNDVYCDLRVDDHQDPIGELRRLFDMWKERALIQEGYRLCEEGRLDEAIAVGLEAVGLSPGEGEPHYHLGCYYSRAGMYDQALAEIKVALELDPSLKPWAREDPDLEPLRDSTMFQVITSE